MTSDRFSPSCCHILLVEDSVINRRVLQVQLQRFNCQVTAVSNGQEAVEFCRDNEVDLILMDCLMPVLNGYDATRQIRGNYASDNAAVPIIGITARDSPSDRRKCFTAGMDALLLKPVSSACLYQEITKWIPPVID